MKFVFECKYRPKYYVIFKNKDSLLLLLLLLLRTQLLVSAKYNPPTGVKVTLKVI